MNVLVVTPTLGRSPYLERTVASVDTLRGSEIVIEHIIVAPPDFVEKLAGLYPKCLVLAEKGGGMYSAINHGIAKSSGNFDFWTYINDDDFLFSAFMEVLDIARKLPPSTPAVIYGQVSIIDSRDLVQNRVTRWRFPIFIKGALAGKRSPLNQQGALWSSATLNLAGFFDESLKYAADYDYFFRCAIKGAKFYYVNSFVAAYRVHPYQLGQNGVAFIQELELVRSRYAISSFFKLVCEGLFIVSNFDVYLWRLIRRKPFGVALFSRFS